MIQNPILKGFYPDPSICRVREDFYLVTSSFSYFPGVPVFHSKDLMHWEQIGHVLDRPEQVHLTYEGISAGIFAPTIRYHEGTFYMITTNVTGFMNFICTAKDPAGPWSQPHVIADAKGIDPSLFFDDDGKCYFTGTAGMGDPRYDHPVVICREIDLETFQLVGPEWAVGDGAMKNAPSPEGPHLYKRNGWYYLLIAEGGTEHYHAVTISRSRCVQGPYENFLGNPILTHRHLGMNYPICNVGHADLVELPDGSWYMVCLGSRLVNGYHKPMGRETFLMPVAWEEDWPVVSPGTGRVEWEYPAPNLPEVIFETKPERDDFPGDAPGMDWNYLGTPYEDYVTVKDHQLHMRLLSKTTVPEEFEGDSDNFFLRLGKMGKTREVMPFFGKRMQSAVFTAETKLMFSPEENEKAGLLILQNNANQIRISCSRADDDHVKMEVFSVHYQERDGKIHYEETEEGSALLPKSEGYVLRMQGDNNAYSFHAGAAESMVCIADSIDGSYLGSESSGGFVGAYIGLFATACGQTSCREAVFDYFTIHNES